jgi:small subunit ribosomal protein S1
MTDPQSPEPTNTPTADAPASPAPSAEPAAAPASSEGVSASSDAVEGGSEAATHESEEAGEAGEGEEAAAGEATPEGAPKKRRRRRRKKKPQGEASAEGEAKPAEEGGEATEGTEKRPPRPRRERPERERPAFNVGDVVFGKVTEINADALFVDLSGKARAIFDLRELLITEDDVEEYTKADKREAEEIAAARAASGGAAQSTSDVSAEAAEPSEATPVEAAEPTAEREAEAAAPEAAASEPAAPEAAVSEAAVPEPAAPEPAAPEGQPQLPRVIMEPGAPFVGLVHNDGGRGGLVVLTHHPKRVQKAKAVVSDASRSGALIFGLVTGTIKGGVEVDVDGLRAFAPASHVELRPGADLSHLVGKRLPFAVTQYAKRGRDVVLSRRAMLEAEAKERREEALKNIEIGSVVDGIVRTVVPFGAFVDVGGVEGLVPLSEMSHNRADQPKDVFKVNETVKVKILRLDERGKLWLSRKAAIEDRGTASPRSTRSGRSTWARSSGSSRSVRSSSSSPASMV